MAKRHGVEARQIVCASLAGLSQFVVGCDDATKASQVRPREVQTSSARAELKMPKELWVTSQGSSVIFIRNFENLSPIDKIDLPSGAGPHIITFHSPHFAYVGGMTDGKVYVIDANTRQIAYSAQLAPTQVHQVKVSPDGATALVSILDTKMVTKMSVDEANRSWAVGLSLNIGATTGKRPVCTVFSADSKLAFVSLNPSGIAVVDVASMTLDSQIPTDGFIACGMVKSDANHVVVASSGGGGHIYTLDMTTKTLTSRGVLGATSWHSLAITADGTRGFGSSPLSDEVIVFDLTSDSVKKVAALRFDQVSGVG